MRFRTVSDPNLRKMGSGLIRCFLGQECRRLLRSAAQEKPDTVGTLVNAAFLCGPMRELKPS